MAVLLHGALLIVISFMVSLGERPPGRVDQWIVNPRGEFSDKERLKAIAYRGLVVNLDLYVSSVCIQCC